MFWSSGFGPRMFSKCQEVFQPAVSCNDQSTQRSDTTVALTGLLFGIHIGPLCTWIALLERLPLLEGNWRVTPTSTVIRECRVKEACPVCSTHPSCGANTSAAANASGASCCVDGLFRSHAEIWANRFCAEGFQGPLCDVCSPGFRRTPRGLCGPCSDNAWISWTIAAAVVMALVACLSVLLWRRKVRKRRAAGADSGEARSVRRARVARLRALLARLPWARRASRTSIEPRKSSARWLAILIVPVAIFMPFTERIFRDWARDCDLNPGLLRRVTNGLTFASRWVRYSRVCGKGFTSTRARCASL